jgi:hypothetical protein
MAYTDFLNEALDDLVTLLEASDLRIVNDPRNINPPCVFIDAPQIDTWNNYIVKLNWPVTLISNGPGNLDALRQLLSFTANLVALNVAVMSAQPKVVTVGGQEFAGFELTIPLQAQNGPNP